MRDVQYKPDRFERLDGGSSRATRTKAIRRKTQAGNATIESTIKLLNAFLNRRKQRKRSILGLCYLRLLLFNNGRIYKLVVGAFGLLDVGRHFYRNGSHVTAPLDEHFDFRPSRFEQLMNLALKASRICERASV
jgi:hypothetical protein